MGIPCPGAPARPAGPQRPPTPAGLTAGSRRSRAGCSARAACARTAWLEPLAATAGAGKMRPHLPLGHRNALRRSAGPARAFMDGLGGAAALTRPAPPPHLAGPRPRALPGSEGACGPTADRSGWRACGTRGRGSRDPNRGSMASRTYSALSAGSLSRTAVAEKPLRARSQGQDPGTLCSPRALCIQHFALPTRGFFLLVVC